MDGGFGAALDASAAGAASFQAFVAELARQGSIAAISVTVALLLVMILVQLVKPAGSDAAAAPVLAPAAALALATPTSLGSVAVATAPRDPRPEAEAIPAGSGLSAMDVVALRALRRRIQSGEVAETPTGAERLAFTRWLIEHHKLDG